MIFLKPREIAVGVLIAGLSAIVISCEKASDQEGILEDEADSFNYSNDVELVLNRKILQIEELLKNLIIIEAVRKSNEKNSGKSPKDLQKIDQEWQRESQTSPLKPSVIFTPCSEVLKTFQKQGQDFPEIFVTDILGINVCQTNKTTDYYQADESWWKQSFNQGEGRRYHGPVEYDHSARSESIPLYLPVTDPESGGVIGVTKAVLDISALTEEL